MTSPAAAVAASRRDLESSNRSAPRHRRIEVVGGRVRTITDRSGHYKTKLAHTIRFLQWLNQQGVDLTELPSLYRSETRLESHAPGCPGTTGRASPKSPGVGDS
jgi:hypothetical protein